MSSLVEIPPPIRENINNILLPGVWHSPVTPPCSLLLGKVVDNIKMLMGTGINIVINKSKPMFSKMK